MRPYRSGPPDEPVESVYRRLKSEIARQVADDDLEDIEEYHSGRDEPEHDAELASLIQQGIDLVLSPRQPKWDRLWRDVLEPAGDEKIVLFAQPIETVRALATWLQTKSHQEPAVIIGGQSDEERDRQVARFRDPQGPRFLISSRAGGEGINLQFSRRLVHLDVPWNPMEMEQRVGRVHRFGSRETILVDTIVVRDSRETQAWTVARDRLTSIAKTLVAPDRFENVFSRVMCLIPPEELQTVLINSAASPLDEAEVERLSALVDSGFQDWQNFHDRFAENQRQIRGQTAGLASWKQLRDFLIRHANAQPAAGIERTRFQQSDRQVRSVAESAEVIRIGDNSLRFVGNFDGGLFTGPNVEPVQPLGMNIPYVADVLHQCANPSLPTGAAHLRWGDEHKELRGQLGDEIVILAFARQTLQYDSIGGVRDIGHELFAYAVRPDQTVQLTADQRNILFDLSQSATVRVRPADSTLLSRAQAEETRLIEELWRPADEALRQRMRHAVWPILAVHLTP